MLIIKSPIVLQTISTLNTYSDVLGEKIIGNYQMIGTSIDSEELLHMTMQEPAVYVNMTDAGPFMLENHIYADNQVKLELVNQLINRIMLYNTSHFTYQDEVFVVSMLQKLGITDVNTFMQHIKLHMDRNELLTELIDHYFTNGKTIAYFVRELVQDTIEKNHDLQILKMDNNRDYYLHNEIYKNLMTAECNNIMYNYRNQIRNSTNAVESIQDITWIEQADLIQLSQMRENMFYQTNPVIWQTPLYYESEPLKQEELAEKKIIERIGAAALENIIEKISYEEQQHFHNRYIWKDYTDIFYQGAEGVLERFRYYQNEKVTDTKLENTYTEQMEELTKDEIRLTKLLSYVDIYADTLENENLYQDMQRNIAVSILENQDLQKQLEKERIITERALQQTTSPDIYFEENAEYIQESRMIMQAFQLLREKYDNQYTDIHQKNLFTDQSMMVQKSDNILNNTMVEENHLRYDSKAEETINRNIIETDTANIQNKENNIHNQQDNYLQTFFERYADIEYTSNTPLMENVELLEQINRHNVYMKQLLDSKKDQEDTQEKRVVVNRSQAMRNALRALDDPQTVINEIYKNGIAIEKSIPKEIERILSITDENTRSYYERMMGYQDKTAHDDTHKSEDSTGRIKVNQSQLIEILNNISETTIEGKEAELLFSMVDGESSRPQGVNEKTLMQEYKKNVNNQEYLYHETQIMQQEMKELLLPIEKQRIISDIKKMQADSILDNGKDESILYNLEQGEKEHQIIVEKIYKELQKTKQSKEQSPIQYEMMGYQDKTVYDDTHKNEKSSGSTDVNPNQILEILNNISETTIEGKEAELLFSMVDGESSRPQGVNEKTQIQEYEKNVNNQERLYHETQIMQQEIQESLLPIEKQKIISDIKKMQADSILDNGKDEGILYNLEQGEKEHQIIVENIDKELQKTKLSRDTSQIQYELLNRSIENVLALEHLQTNDIHTTETIQEHLNEVQLIHKSEELMYEDIVDEVMETLESRTLHKASTSENMEEMQVTEKYLKALKQELINQSEEHIVQIVNQNLKTQVHSISDMVYLELERRLKNEQRRRGY